MLDQSGLRSDKKATEEATRLGFASVRFDGFGVKVDWCEAKVAAHLTVHFGAEIAGQAKRLADKRTAADRKREADRQRQTDEIAELGRVKLIALPVREMVEREESSLLDAAEFLVEDPHDRLKVFRSCMGWYRQRKVEGLSPVRDRETVEAVERSIQKHLVLLERRVA
jgi:hypothetical protein